MAHKQRRQFLQGAGGFTLALPLLPSILTASQAAAQTGKRKRFVAYMTDHGGLMGDSIYPAAAPGDTTANIFPGHDGRWGALRRTVNGSTASVAPVLSAPATQLTDRLVSKMNVYRGFDIPFYIAHNTGGHLGNYARNDGNGGDGQAVQNDKRPTIDQLMGWSTSFYGTAAGIRERVMVMGDRGGYSWGWSSPATRSGTIQELSVNRDARSLFQKIFVPTNTTPPPMARKPIVDRVLENYRTLRNGNRRISLTDKQRLDDHLSRISELERKVNLNAPPPPKSCSGAKQVTGDSEGLINGADRKQGFKLFNDVVAAAFICDTSRIASITAASPLISFSGSWHQDIAHQWNSVAPQTSLRQHYQVFFEHAFLDLASKLDVDEGDGTTILDNTLLQWSQESGQQTHDNAQCPVITFGSAAGFFKTGMLADYRRLNSFFPSSDPLFPKISLGLTYNRWLATALQAMGMPASEWERPGEKGYGNTLVGDGYKTHYTSTVIGSASQVVPFVQA
jgi:Protein of unknown function (DUF1552)